MNLKMIPFGKYLAVRQRFNNPPEYVVIYVGDGSWQKAKQWPQNSDICPLVLPDGEQPGNYQWPVAGCRCVIEWSPGPSESQVSELIRCLLLSGSMVVVVRPMFVDRDSPAWLYENGKWRQLREITRVYQLSEDGAYAQGCD